MKIKKRFNKCIILYIVFALCISFLAASLTGCSKRTYPKHYSKRPIPCSPWTGGGRFIIIGQPNLGGNRLR